MDMERKVVFALLVALVALTATLITQGLLRTYEIDVKGQLSPDATGTRSDDLRLLNEATRKTQESYYLPEKVQDLSDLEASYIRALMESLDDPYSRYNTRDEYGEFRDSLNGDYEGIGSYIEARDLQIIANPIKGGPAEAAGVRAGDVILTINGESAEGFSVTEASMRLRGPKGTEVVVEVLHADGRIELISIIRDRIHINSVEYTLVSPDIGMISINSFGSNTGSEVRDALFKLDESAQLSGLILDLRGNGGGYLQVAEEIASLFVEKHELLLIERQRDRRVDHPSIGNQRDNLPIAVLIDEGTASASEILAAAIRDNDMGILIGRNSFGKGVIQSTFSLSDGSVLILTTAEYFTPDEHQVQGIGLSPSQGYYVDSWYDPWVEIGDEMARLRELLETLDLSVQGSAGDAYVSASAAVLSMLSNQFRDLFASARDDEYSVAQEILQGIREVLDQDAQQLLAETEIVADEHESILFEQLFASFAHRIQPRMEELQERLELNYIEMATRWLRSSEVAGKLCPCKSPVASAPFGDGESSE